MMNIYYKKKKTPTTLGILLLSQMLHKHILLLLRMWGNLVLWKR